MLQCAECLFLRAAKFQVDVLRNISKSVTRQKRRSHYEVLEVENNATPVEIKAAFIRLSKELHPDMNPNDPHNHQKFVQMNEAYTTLAKNSSRREYDMTLAHRLYCEENLKRHGGYRSHTAQGTGYQPGSGTAREQGFEAQKPFWDETIWYMRDKSRDRDAFYEEDSYYGIKGVRRMPNSYILAFCFAVMGLGTVTFFLCLKYSSKKSREYIEKMDRKNLALYHQSRENARKYSTQEQINTLLLSQPRPEHSEDKRA